MANNEAEQVYRGSEWRKWDLQVHCPDDVLNNRFDGKDHDDKWEKYVAKVEESGLEVIGLTNYFCIEGYEKLLRYKYNGRLENLKLVLPNVEFRLSQPNRNGEYINIHLLFSNQISLNKIKDFLGRLPIISTDPDRRGLFCSQNDLQQIGYEKALVEFSQLRETLKENFLHRKDYLVAGVCRGYGSFRPEQNEGRGTSLAIEIDKMCDFFFGNAEDIDHFLNTNRYEDAEPKAVIRTSDAHDLEKIGTLSTWIKANPTFDGLKQIIYEPVGRVDVGENDPGAFRHVIIDSFAVSESNDNFFLKNVGNMFLNPGLNCVIGPRGAGKSALLDAMSFSLGDKEVLDEERNNYVGFFFKKNESNIISAQVKNSYSGEIRELSPRTAKESGFLFDYYHQKQIGSLADPNNEDELSRFLFEKVFIEEVGADSLFNKLNEQRDEFITRLTVNREQIVACEKEISKEEDIKNNINEKNTRAKFLSQKSVIHLLEERNKIIKIRERIRRIKDRIENVEDQPLISKEDSVDTIFFREIQFSDLDPEETVLPKEWKKLEKEVDAFLNSLSTNKEDLGRQIAGLTQKVVELEPCFNFVEQLTEIWGRIQSESNKHGLTITIADIGKLDSIQKEIVALQEQLNNIANRKREKLTLLEERKRLLVGYNSHLSSVKGRLDAGFEALLKDDGAILNDTIKLDIQTAFSLESYLEIVESKAKHESDDDSVPRFPNRKPLIELFKSLGSENIINSFRDNNFGTWSIRGFGSGGLDYFRKMKNKEEVAMYLEELLPALTSHLLWRPDSTKEFKKLNRCSIGERGTALLSVILVTGREPLIIDQPEDDLDHFYLYKTLTPIIREVKKRRQLIFATHDANVVVNGDAELIIIVTSQDDKFGTVTLAAIENQENREKVMDILEGGRDAFKKREQKYHVYMP